MARAVSVIGQLSIFSSSESSFILSYSSSCSGLSDFVSENSRRTFSSTTWIRRCAVFSSRNGRSVCMYSWVRFMFSSATRVTSRFEMTCPSDCCKRAHSAQIWPCPRVPKICTLFPVSVITAKGLPDSLSFTTVAVFWCKFDSVHPGQAEWLGSFVRLSPDCGSSC